MKRRITKREVKETNQNIICIAYGHAQNLLSGIDPYAYTCGGDGWHSDIYHVASGVAVSTGYQPFGNIKPGYDLVKRYEREARAICDREYIWDKRQEQLNTLLAEFVEEVTA